MIGEGSLWLSTTRGICRVRKQDIWTISSPARFAPSAGELRRGGWPAQRAVRAGLSDQRAVEPDAAMDGLWFPTSRGLAVLDPNERPPSVAAPVVHLLEVHGGRTSDPVPRTAARLAPRQWPRAVPLYGHPSQRAGTVHYSYRLEGLDRDWVEPVARRVTNYNSLPHGHYRFVVRAARSRRAVGAKPPSPSSCCRISTKRPGSASLCGRLRRAGIWGLYPAAAAADPPALRAGAGGARAAGAGDSRHAGAGLRGHFVAARRGGCSP